MREGERRIEFLVEENRLLEIGMLTFEDGLRRDNYVDILTDSIR